MSNEQEMREAFEKCFGADFDDTAWSIEAEIWNDAWQAALAEQPAQGEADPVMHATDDYRAALKLRQPTGWYQKPLYAAPPAPSVPADVVKDAARFRWLTDDHDCEEARAAVRMVCRSIPTRSISGTRLDIDAFMLAAAPDAGEVPRG